MASMESPEGFRVAFLVYDSRSGSTMFARHLSAASPDIVVVPEVRWLEFLLSEGDERIREKSSEELFRLLKMDPQTEKTLGFSDDILRRIVKRAPERGIAGVMEGLGAEYAASVGRDPRVVIFKRGSSLFAYDRLVRLFPGCAFIHVYRDIRGAANSMLSGRVPETPQLRMGRGEVIHMAKYWVRYLNLSRDLKAKGEVPFYEISYESLCYDRDKVLEEVIHSFGCRYLPPSRRDEGTSFKIGEHEKAIHQLVDKDPVLDRIEAWKRELKTWEGIAIEKIAGETMRERGYELWYLPRTPDWKIPFYMGYARFMRIVRYVWFYWWTGVFYLRNFGMFRQHIRFVLRYRARFWRS